MKKNYRKHGCQNINYYETKSPEQIRKDFSSHMTSYIAVNAFLCVIWFFTGANHFWPMYTMLGWGIGLFSHAFAAFSYIGKEKYLETQKESEYI